MSFLKLFLNWLEFSNFSKIIFFQEIWESKRIWSFPQNFLKLWKILSKLVNFWQQLQIISQILKMKFKKCENVWRHLHLLHCSELPCIVLNVYDQVSRSDIDKRIYIFKRVRDDSGPEDNKRVSYFQLLVCRYIF